MLLAQANIREVHNPATNFGDPANWNIASFLTGGDGGLNLINLAFFIIGLVFFANLIIAATIFIGSEGQPDRIAKANARLGTGLIGLVIVFSSFVIVRLIAALFGFDASVPID